MMTPSKKIEIGQSSVSFGLFFSSDYLQIGSFLIYLLIKTNTVYKYKTLLTLLKYNFYSFVFLSATGTESRIGKEKERSCFGEIQEFEQQVKNKTTYKARCQGKPD